MYFQRLRPILFAAASALAVSIACLVPVSADSRNKPVGEEVEFFEAIESGRIEAKPIAKNSLSGNVIIKNLGNQPIRIKLPESFVIQQVLPQFGGGGGGGGFGGGQQGGGQQGGGGQAGGGGFGGQGGQQQGGQGGGRQGGGGGGGFFSVGPDRTARLAYTSVCLEHGKMEPSPRMNYEIKKVESYTKDVELQVLIKQVGLGKLDTEVAQAAAWHLANKMSWDELAAKKVDHIGYPDSPYFLTEKLAIARQLTAAVKVAAIEERDRREKEAAQKPATVVSPIKSPSTTN